MDNQYLRPQLLCSDDIKRMFFIDGSPQPVKQLMESDTFCHEYVYYHL